MPITANGEALCGGEKAAALLITALTKWHDSANALLVYSPLFSLSKFVSSVSLIEIFAVANFEVKGILMEATFLFIHSAF